MTMTKEEMDEAKREFDTYVLSELADREQKPETDSEREHRLRMEIMGDDFWEVSELERAERRMEYKQTVGFGNEPGTMASVNAEWERLQYLRNQQEEFYAALAGIVCAAILVACLVFLT